MNKKELEAFAREAAKTLKTEKDLNEFSQMLTKITAEAALNAELDEHLGYDRNQPSDNANSRSRNGYTSKTLRTEDGQFELNRPRDREGSFEPQLVKKGQTRFTSMDDKILSLYAKGMTPREIVTTFKEMYDADISPTPTSKVTEAVIDQVVCWLPFKTDPWFPSGPIRHKVKKSGDEKFEQEIQIHQLYDTPPQYLTRPEEQPKITDIYRWIVENEARTQQIVSDVIDCIYKNRHPIVLTERREHAEAINNLLKKCGIDSIVLRGAMKAAERKRVDEHINTAQAIVATGKYVGEGFDLPRLDTLFLPMPIAWKGTLAQYAGRIHRESDGKTRVRIHDYVDCGLPMLQRMFNKRENSYKAMGYTLLSPEELANLDKAGRQEILLI